MRKIFYTAIVILISILIGVNIYLQDKEVNTVPKFKVEQPYQVDIHKYDNRSNGKG